MPLFLKMESCVQGCYILLELAPFPADAETGEMSSSPLFKQEKGISTSGEIEIFLVVRWFRVGTAKASVAGSVPG